MTNIEFNKEKNKLNIPSSIELKDLDEYEQDHDLPEKILLIEIFGIFINYPVLKYVFQLGYHN